MERGDWSFISTYIYLDWLDMDYQYGVNGQGPLIRNTLTSVPSNSHWSTFSQVLDPGKLAEDLAGRLEIASTVLVDRLFEHLSRIPDKDNSSNNGRNGAEGGVPKSGLTIPASAIGWLSTQIYPRDNDADAALTSPQESAALWMGASMRDRLSLLKYLLPRATHLRVSNDEWPRPVLSSTGAPNYGSSNNQNGYSAAGRLQSFVGREIAASGSLSVHSALTMDTMGAKSPPNIRTFLTYYYDLQNRPRVDLRLFPNLTVLFLEQVPPECVFNLSLLRDKLVLLRTERAGIFDMMKFLSPRPPRAISSEKATPAAAAEEKEEEENDDEEEGHDEEDPLAPVTPAPITSVQSSSYSKLTHLRLSHCSLGEMSAMRGKRIRRKRQKAKGDTSNIRLVVTLPPPIAQMTNLVSLNLSHNQIRTVKTALAGLSSLTRLERLDLSYNFLTTMKGAFTMLGSIEVLILTGNRIRNSQGLEKVYSLKTLRLDLNDMADLGDVVGLANLPELTHLSLRGNPLLADDLSVRSKIFNAFKDRRLDSLGDNPTYRELFYILPILDGLAASKEELLELRNLSYRRSAPTSLSSRVAASRSMESRRSLDEMSDVSSITASSDAMVMVRRVKRVGRRRRARVLNLDALSTPTTPKKMNVSELSDLPSIGFSVSDVVATLSPPKNPSRPITDDEEVKGEEPAEQKEEAPEKEFLGAQMDIDEELLEELESSTDPILQFDTEKTTTEDTLIKEEESHAQPMAEESVQEEKKFDIDSTNATSAQSETEKSPDDIISQSPDEEEGHIQENAETSDDKDEELGEGEESPAAKMKPKVYTAKLSASNGPALQLAQSSTLSNETTSVDETREEVASELEEAATPMAEIPSTTSDNDASETAEEVGSFHEEGDRKKDDAEESSAAEHAIKENGETDTLGVDSTKIAETGKATKVHGDPFDTPNPQDSGKNSVASAVDASKRTTSVGSVEPSVGAASDVPKEMVSFPEHVWDDGLSVQSSLGESRVSHLNQLLQDDKYSKAESTFVYDGPDGYKHLSVPVNLDTYCRCFVFPAADPEINSVFGRIPEEEVMRASLEASPRIQLRPLDREVLEDSLRELITEMKATSIRENFQRVGRQDLLACGKSACRRLHPMKNPRRGFHGDILFTNGKLERVSESRKLILISSDRALYLVADIDPVTTNQQSKHKERRFPAPIPLGALFQNAIWPHAVARHPWVNLKKITIGFGFQRLTLHYSPSTEYERQSPNNELTYVLTTANKLRTIELLQHFQGLAKEAFSMGQLQGKDLAIENDDKQVLEALSEAVSPDTVGVVLHYQILAQRWKHGDRGMVRRVCMVTDTNIYLLDEDYAGDGSDSVDAGSKNMGDVRFQVVDSAPLMQIDGVQASTVDPKGITVVIRPLSVLQRIHNWRLVCGDADGAEKLLEDVRKAKEMASM